jgi:hypothetical protein
MMKRWSYTKLLIGSLVLGLVLGIVLVRPLVAALSASGTDASRTDASGNGPDQLTLDADTLRPAQGQLADAYTGQAILEGTYTGVFSDPVAADPVVLGNIDLGLIHLEDLDGAVSGYVALERTLVFTEEHVVEGDAVGPHVGGPFDGSALELRSEKFHRILSEERTLDDGRRLPEQLVTRQFQLVSTQVQTDGASIEGIYRETFWGLSPEPVTVVGTFDLLQWTPRFVYKQIYLPLVIRRE